MYFGVYAVPASIRHGSSMKLPCIFAAEVQGRATVDVDMKFASTREGGLEKGVLRMVLDGYNAPVTAGNFLDLVNRKFYDGMEVQRADGFVVQTGNPGGEVGTLLPSPGALAQSHCISEQVSHNFRVMTQAHFRFHAHAC